VPSSLNEERIYEQGTITSVKVLVGDLDITRLAYDSETQSIHIGNVSETVTITVE
jgi:hypothetical protein